MATLVDSFVIAIFTFYFSVVLLQSTDIVMGSLK